MPVSIDGPPLGASTRMASPGGVAPIGGKEV